MTNSRKTGLLTVLALMASVSGNNYEEREFPKSEPKPKGKCFIIEGEEIWALNEKNARRKYNNKHKTI